MSNPKKSVRQWLGEAFGGSLKALSEALTAEQFGAFEADARRLMPAAKEKDDDDDDDDDETDDDTDEAAKDEKKEAKNEAPEALTPTAEATTDTPAPTAADDNERAQLRAQVDALTDQLSAAEGELARFKAHHAEAAKAGAALPGEDASSRAPKNLDSGTAAALAQWQRKHRLN